MWPFNKKPKEIPTADPVVPEAIIDDNIYHLYANGYKLCKIFQMKLKVTAGAKSIATSSYFFLLIDNENHRRFTVRIADHDSNTHVYLERLKDCKFYNEILIPWLGGYNFDNIPINYKEINDPESDFFKKLKDDKGLIEEVDFVK